MKWLTPAVAARAVLLAALLAALLLEAMGAVPPGVLAACQAALRQFVW